MAQPGKEAPGTMYAKAELVTADWYTSDSVTFTVLLGGKYFTVERARPDFPHINDDAWLSIQGDQTQQIKDKLKERQLEISRPSGGSRAEDFLITVLLASQEIAFGEMFGYYVLSIGMENPESHDLTYYYARRAFTEVWLRVAALIG